MSDHNHSHSGPNAHNHSHGPPQQTPQQMPIPPPPDPVLQAALDARIQSVQLKLVPPADPTKGVFQVESKDPKFQYDWEAFNSLALQLATALPPPHESIPPPINPATVLQNPRSHAVVKAKDEGNKLYGQHKYNDAIQMYSTAAQITITRPDWEASNMIKEELAMVLSNRSAAHASLGDYVSALVDADVVIQIKRPWSKGHFRKAKALQGLEEYEEAKLALGVGLSFEPNNAEMLAFVAELDQQIKEQAEKKAEKSDQKEKS